MSNISNLKVTSQVFSELLGVSRRTVESWKKEGLPYSKKGIPFVEGFQWWQAERFKELDEMRVARTRREVAKAKIAEFDAKEKEKNLIPKDQSEKWLRSHIELAKSGFWGLPRRMAPILGPILDEKEIEFLLMEQIRNILEEMAAPLKKGARKAKRGKERRRGAGASSLK